MCTLQKIWRFLLDVLFPAFCLGCKKEGVFLCEDCRKTIPFQSEQVCPFCYQQSDFGLVCKKCKPIHQAALDGVLVVARFEEKSLLQRCIHHFKYESLKDLAPVLGSLLVEVFERNRLTHVGLSCVPLSRKRLQWRGFNQAELLTRELSAKFGLRLFHLLSRTSFVAPQMELSREERKKNVANTFALNLKEWENFPKNLEVLLVDDVCTTTATLEACAQVLKKAGVAKVCGIVLARAY